VFEQGEAFEDTELRFDQLSKGNRANTRVPLSSEHNSHVPPSCRTLSRIPRIPTPACTSLLNDVSSEIRTISHLLHPPFLDEAGLASALRSYVEGFTERSNMRLEPELPDHFDRLSRDLETAIVRLVQECLTNVHRYSESAVATIRLIRSADEIRLEVADEGKGIPVEKQAELLCGTPGVGIRGMRERLRQLGEPWRWRATELARGRRSSRN
jgi:signal transduction histidine kinase